MDKYVHVKYKPKGTVILDMPIFKMGIRLEKKK